MICFGVVNAICSVIFGSLMKYIGRFSIIVFGTVVHMGIFSYLLFWRPHPDSPLIFFIISGLWGVGDAVWQTQINGKKFSKFSTTRTLMKLSLAGLYGTLFRRNKEAAFSNYRLWESLGFVIAYAYSTALCARMKLYSVMGVLGFGAFCYIIVEIRQLRKVN
jgi:MFS family permease